MQRSASIGLALAAAIGLAGCGGGPVDSFAASNAVDNLVVTNSATAEVAAGNEARSEGDNFTCADDMPTANATLESC